MRAIFVGLLMAYIVRNDLPNFNQYHYLHPIHSGRRLSIFIFPLVINSMPYTAACDTIVSLRCKVFLKSVEPIRSQLLTTRKDTSIFDHPYTK